MIEFMNEERENFMYNGPKKALKMLSTEQFELLKSTTVFDSSQLSIYNSMDNL